MTLHVPSFGGGVVLEGAADTRRIDEVLEADSLDIGPRGALVCTAGVTDYVTILDGDAVPVPWSRLYAIFSNISGLNIGQVLVIGEGSSRGDPAWPIGPAYLLRVIERVGMGSPISGTLIVQTANVPFAVPQAPAVEGVIVTGVSFPGVYQGSLAKQNNFAFFNLGAREGFAPNSNVAFGLYVLLSEVGSSAFGVAPIVNFDALGTGPFGIVAGGTHSKQLRFRGIVAYNNHVFGWGYDSADTTDQEGPARVMFCNLGNPFKWGNDNIAAAGDRAFTDSDAIVLGDAGEIVRGAIKWAGKLFFGTNRSLHFIAGYGRDSFLTDGATPVMRAYNIVGPTALIEGPDRLLYGVSDQGLWRFAGGGDPEPLFLKLRDFAGNSKGFWDLIWTDPTRLPDAYPGTTNQDLVWTAVDWERRQVLVGIPWCSSVNGYGYGNDTVVIKFHVETGGFTRQVFPGVQYTAAGYLRREGQEPEARFLGTGTLGFATIERFGYRASPASTIPLPSLLPRATFGYYAPFGPDGDGVVRRAYLTLSWEQSLSLPIVFQVTSTIDQSQIDSFALYIQPGAPAALPGDYWLDTSQSDISLGNATAAPTIPARGGYLLKTLNEDGDWLTIAGQGAKGTRVTIQLPLTRIVGTRVTMQALCTAASGRFQLEGFGMNPGEGEAAA